MAEIEEINIDEIIVGTRLRALSKSKVDGMMSSMDEVGLIQPITVRFDGNEARLVIGCHRLEAAKRLGWKTITCMIAPSADEDAARLIEIDENLIRNELSAAERALHVRARKEIYERLHPETRHGTNQHTRSRKLCDSSEGEQDGNAKRFTKETSERTNRSERAVQLDTTRADNIAQIADAIGTSLDIGEELDALSKLSPKRQSELIQRAASGERVSAKAELKKFKREEKEMELADRVKFSVIEGGRKVYNVIYSDPPWRFEPYSRKTGMDRAADNHYPCSSVEDICKIDCKSDRDAVLFLWSTAPMLPEALEVMNAWGFQYKSQIVWVKDKIGTGYWARNKHELLLIGTKGNIPAPAPGTQSESVIYAPVQQHSKKPDEFYEIIERLFPNLPKLEMFARKERDGWDNWGYESPSMSANA